MSAYGSESPVAALIRRRRAEAVAAQERRWREIQRRAGIVLPHVGEPLASVARAAVVRPVSVRARGTRSRSVRAAGQGVHFWHKDGRLYLVVEVGRWPGDG